MAERVRRGPVSVPPSPVIALQLMRQLGDERTSLSTLRSTLEQDQSLVAVVLRLANSVQYRWGREVAAIPQAIVVLGRKVLRELSLGNELHQRTLSRGPLVSLRRRAWRESLASAHLASWLAPHFKVLPDEAFVAGLLHDIGRVPSISVLEELWAEHPVIRALTDESAWELIERHHVELGAVVARSWGLPRALSLAIEAHHSSSTEPMLEVLRATDTVVSLMDGAPWLGPEKFEFISALDESQRMKFAAQLPMIPMTLDAFREPPDGEAVDYELKLDDVGNVVRRVLLTHDGLVNEAHLLEASDDHLIVTTPLKTGWLIRVNAGEAMFHARVTGRQKSSTVLKPWALDERQLGQWRAFIAQPSNASAQSAA